MLNWLRSQRLARGAHVNVFTMTNDFLPSYGSSNVNYHRTGRLAQDGSLMFPVSEPKPAAAEGLISALRDRSFFGSRIYQIVQARNAATEPSGSQSLIRETGFASLVSDCSELQSFLAEYPDAPPLLVDYVTFATTPECWSADARRQSTAPLRT